MNKAELDKRANARKQLLTNVKSSTEKKAYFQGGGGPNDPATLGYPNEIVYPRDLGEDPRMWEQSWFEGAAAETKQVMGPQGSELELKQRMFRAKLSAKLEKVASNQNRSFWTFSANGKPLIVASLDDIFAREGKKLSPDLLKWASSANYAKLVMKEIRKHGPDKVAYLLTGRALTKEATKKLLTGCLVHRMKEVFAMARKVRRSHSIVDGDKKAVLAQTYNDLKESLAELKLIANKLNTDEFVKTASRQDRLAFYRCADEALLDAEDATGEAVDALEGADEKIDEAEAALPEASDSDQMMPEEMAAPATSGLPTGDLGAGVEDGKNTKLQEDVEKSHPADVRFDIQESEQGDIQPGALPTGDVLNSDKVVKSPWNNMILDDIQPGALPSGDVNTVKEVSPASNAAPMGEAPAAPEGEVAAPAEEAAPEAPADDEAEESEDEVEGADEEAPTEEAPKEDAQPEEEDEVEGADEDDEDEEEVEASAKTGLTKEAGMDEPEYWEKVAQLGASAGMEEVAKYFENVKNLSSSKSAAAPAPSALPTEAPADLTTALAEKKIKSAREEYESKINRAYELALAMQEKGMIKRTAVELKKMVNNIMGYDESAFKTMKQSVEQMNVVAAKNIDENITKVAGKQHKVVTSGKTETAHNDVDSWTSELKNLWP